eukprot:1161110-Pelagomonas_calceolata.AAC.7
MTDSIAIGQWAQAVLWLQKFAEKKKKKSTATASFVVEGTLILGRLHIDGLMTQHFCLSEERVMYPRQSTLAHSMYTLDHTITASILSQHKKQGSTHQ